MDRRLPWAKWILITPLALEGIYDAARDVVASSNFTAAAQWPPLLPGALNTALIMTAVGIFFMALAHKYHDPALASDDKRRLKLLYWGSTVAMGPSFVLLLYSLIVLHREASDGDLLAYSIMAMAIFPVTMAYVIVVGRALDVRMIVRTGMQYALARGGIKMIQAGLAITTVLLLVSMADKGHFSRPAQMAQIGLAVILVVRIRDLGERLRRWVDRRFFREAYNAEQILSELSEQVRSILNTHELLETVARKISESLHVRHIAVMLQEGGAFRPALATGYELPDGYELSSSAPSIARLRLSRAPIDATGQKDFAALDAQLVFPLASRKELLGFISLGPKKSEEPYSPGDTNLLRTVAAQTGLALENSRLSEAFAGEVAKRETLHREIEIAREVQQRLFPQNLPEVAGARVCRPLPPGQRSRRRLLRFPGALPAAAWASPSATFRAREYPPALLMASLQASVRGQSLGGGDDIAGLVTNVNQLVYDASRRRTATPRSSTPSSTRPRAA